MFEKKVNYNKYISDIDNIKKEHQENIEYLNRVITEYQIQIKEKMDSIYYNNFTRQGTLGDVNEKTHIKPFSQYSIMNLENLYSMDPIIKRIVQTRTKYVFKDGFYFKTKNEQYQKKFNELFFKKYRLWDKFKSAYLSGMIHGHTFLLIKANNMSYETPIHPSEIKKIDSCLVINRFFLAAYPEEVDFEFNPNFYYTVQQPLEGSDFDLSTSYGLQSYINKIPQMGIDKIHSSHMLGFIGSKLMPYTFRTNLHFHDSYIRQIQNAAKNYNAIMDSIATMMTRIPFPIYSAKGLNSKMDVPEQRAKFAAAMSAREQMRAQNNVSVIDSEEKYEWYTPALNGMAELANQAKELLLLDCEMTHDVLFGEGSMGQTTGRAEKTIFQNMIEIEQTEQILPKIEWWMEVFQSAHGLKIPDDIEIIFGHHETPTEKEQSEIFSSYASGVGTFESQGYDCSALIKEKYPKIVESADFEDMEEDNENDKKQEEKDNKEQKEQRKSKKT